MKNLNCTSINIRFIPVCLVLLFGILFGISGRAFAQPDEADKMILEIEAYRKFKVTSVNDREFLDVISDSANKVVEIISFSRKGDQFGKDVEHVLTAAGTVELKYYFNQSGILFAMIEKTVSKDNATRVVSYYFAKGELHQAVDENKGDVTATVNQRELEVRLLTRYGKEMLGKTK